MEQKNNPPRKWTFDENEPDLSNLPEVEATDIEGDIINEDGEPTQKAAMKFPKSKYFDDDSRDTTPRLRGTSKYLKGVKAYITTREGGDRVATQLSKSQLGYEVLLDSKEVTIPGGAKLLVVNGETGVLALGLGAKFPKTSIYSTDLNVRNLGITERNIGANHQVDNVFALNPDELNPNDPGYSGPFDVVVYNPGRFDSKDLIASQLEYIKTIIKEDGGKVYILTHKDAGLAAIKERIGLIFPSWTETEPIERGRGGFRVFRISPLQSDISTKLETEQHKIRINILGKSFEVETYPSLFSSKEIDKGTRLLIETIAKKTSNPGQRVLDVGCGWGAIGLSWAMAYADSKITMVDVDFRAVGASMKNIELLDLASRANALISPDLKTAPIGSFDLVLSNPPFHAQERVLNELFQGVRDKMNKKAECWIVVEKTYLTKFEEVMRKTFGHVTIEVENKDGYYILRSQK